MPPSPFSSYKVVVTNAHAKAAKCILIGKLRKCELDEWTVRQTENWLKERAQSTKSSWRSVTSDVPQEVNSGTSPVQYIHQ